MADLPAALVGAIGLEPTTPTRSRQCSNQLSYAPGRPGFYTTGMELILWRHADAEDGADDMARRLTPQGERQAAAVAQWLQAHLPERYTVVASPAVRAQQTAAALGATIVTDETLAPGASVSESSAAAESAFSSSQDCGRSMAKPPASAATRRNGSLASVRLRRISAAMRSANTSFQSAPSRPASCILRSLPRCASTMRARRACSMRENPGMSALEST